MAALDIEKIRCELLNLEFINWKRSQVWDPWSQVSNVIHDLVSHIKCICMFLIFDNPLVAIGYGYDSTTTM